MENEKLSIFDIIDIVNGDISAKNILLFRRVYPVKRDDGSYEIKENKWNLHSKIILKSGDVANLNERVETTIGRAIANKLLKLDPFGKFFPYDNKSIFINDFINLATFHLIKGDVNTEQMTILFKNSVWLVRFADLILPSLSQKVLTMPASSKKLKAELIEKHKDLIKNGDPAYVNMVEMPVLEDIKKSLKDDPSFMLYYTGKPSIGNNLKQTIGTFSPIFNISTGKYDISTGNLLEGHDPKIYNSIANMNISGTYSRNIETQNGGAMVKTIYNSMSTMRAAPAGTDCGTTIYKNVELTNDNKNSYMWNYIFDNGRTILLTPDIINKYIGTICNFRSTLYCKYDSKFEICNKCCGEIPYKTNLLTIGLLSSRLPFQIVNSSLKAFHDSTISLTDINPFQYMKLSK